MNKLKFMGCMGILAAALMFAACEKENSTKANFTTDGGLVACDRILFNAEGDADDNAKQIGNGDDQFVFTGKQTLKRGVYSLVGWVYIADGAVLTIEPGTVIKGDKATMAALIAERGGKLIAKGSANAPIVFTSAQPAGSRRPGDWGGLILCGKARNNAKEMQIEGGPRTKHGGEDDNDNSGVLSYVRIEFAGYPFETDKEINGLTLGSVGKGTQVDHVQVSYSNDDSIEWFGGAVDCKYLIAYKGWDDDFDTDNGFRGKVQFALAVRDSRIADTSQSNGFESDNNASGSTADPYTTAVFSNVTFVGPKEDKSFVNDKSYINGGSYFPGNGSALGKFQSAMHIRRNSRLSCFNSVAVSWPVGLILDNEKGDTQGNATNGQLKLQNVWFANMDICGSDYNKVYQDNLVTVYPNKDKGVEMNIDDTKPSFSSTWFKAQSGNKYEANANGWFDATGYMPASGSPLLSAASFSDALVSGMEKVNYIGAFAAGDKWLEGWTEFNPQNAKYE